MPTRKLLVVFVAITVLLACFVTLSEGQGLWNCIRPCSETYKSLSCYVDCGALNKGTGACIPKRPVSDEYVCCCTG
ncbi:hypothetical protein E6C27_scaffold1167G00010 [Cucumis melo var. makuwa]|uniref:Defensin-like domain-containing protein n=1 Tax=Cucumis melo var. makuwa TaxID=1194695 RepID=A0A5A7TJH1_CUCMM|nr:hypothetical protein E6C27_scaffold1167G00010 [Cucumis melo var. makuwa]